MERGRSVGTVAGRKPKQYFYHTCCVNAAAEDINAMVDAAHRVTYNTMLRNCEGFLAWAARLGYGRGGFGLHIKDDWAVTFWKSRYRGRRCYFVSWSAIEYIWTSC